MSNTQLNRHECDLGSDTGRPFEAIQTLVSLAKRNFLKKHRTEPESTGEN
jgi:hypothetical protein